MESRRRLLFCVVVALLSTARGTAQSPENNGPTPALQLPAIAPPPLPPSPARLGLAVADDPGLPPAPVPVELPTNPGDLTLRIKCAPLWCPPDPATGERPTWLISAPLRKKDGTGLFDNLYFFAGLDGAKEPEDLGINSNFGARIHFNWGIPVWQEAGVGIQVGSGLNFANNAEPILHALGGSSTRVQSFTSLGLFQRTEGGLNWGFTYDFRFDDYYRQIDTSQWRFQIGQNVGKCDEIGVWGTVHERTAGAVVAHQLYSFEAINQYNVFWRHFWPGEATTRVWLGVAENHDGFVFGLPVNHRINHPLVFGADLYIPLNDCVFLFGEANFITPNDTGTITATLGLAITWGGARDVVRGRFMPLLPVANNSSFAVNLRP
jgi:hypothetical protein